MLAKIEKKSTNKKENNEKEQQNKKEKRENSLHVHTYLDRRAIIYEDD